MNTTHYESWLLSDNPALVAVARRMIDFVQNGCKKEKQKDIKKPSLDPRVIKYIRENNIQSAEHYKGHVTADGVININPSEERIEHDLIDEEPKIIESTPALEQKTAQQMIAEVRAEPEISPFPKPAGVNPSAAMPTPAFIKNIPSELGGKVFTTEKYDNGGIRKTITPEALKERMKLFTGDKK